MCRRGKGGNGNGSESCMSRGRVTSERMEGLKTKVGSALSQKQTAAGRPLAADADWSLFLSSPLPPTGFLTNRAYRTYIPNLHTKGVPILLTYTTLLLYCRTPRLKLACPCVHVPAKSPLSLPIAPYQTCLSPGSPTWTVSHAKTTSTPL